MRRFLGPALLGVGVFLVVLGGLLKFYVADRVILTPSVLRGSMIEPGLQLTRKAGVCVATAVTSPVSSKAA